MGVQAHGTRHIPANGLLQWVARVQVVFQAQAMLHAIGQKTRVFAAAVVVALVKHQIGRWRQVLRGEQTRYMAAAAQSLVAQPGFVQHALHGADVLRDA